MRLTPCHAVLLLLRNMLFTHLDHYFSLHVFAIMRKKQLTSEQLAEILEKIAQKISIADIATEYNVARSTIYRRVANFRRDKRLGRKKTERRTKLTTAQKTQLHNLLMDQPFSTLAEIKENLNLPVALRTITNYCRRLKLYNRISPKKFFVNNDNCEERMLVARRRLNWPLTHWKKIVFCDECGIDNSGFHRRRVWRTKSSRFDPKYVYRAPNKSLRLNIFSWVSIHGTGELIVYDKMNSDFYCQYVVPKMISSLREQFGSDDFLIVHDNASFSVCDATRNFLHQNDYAKYFLPIPAYSPDMNIIENLWAYLKQKARSHCFDHGRTHRRADFIELVRQIWSDIPQSVIEHLYSSLQNRMRCILTAEGLPTRY